MTNPKKQCVACRLYRQIYLNSGNKICNRCLDAYWIYAFECHGFMKVGYTSDVDKRLQMLSHATPFLITPVYKKLVLRKPIVLFVEKKIHEQLKDIYSGGEWYYPYSPVVLVRIESIVSKIFKEYSLNFEYFEKQEKPAADGGSL